MTPDTCFGIFSEQVEFDSGSPQFVRFDCVECRSRYHVETGQLALAFWRTTIDEIAPAAVADELGVSIESVWQARSRVLRRLRELLE